MNLSQNNSAGCAALMAAGAFPAVAPLLAQMIAGGGKAKGAPWRGRGTTCAGEGCLSPCSWRRRGRQQLLPERSTLTFQFSAQTLPPI